MEEEREVKSRGLCVISEHPTGSEPKQTEMLPVFSCQEDPYGAPVKRPHVKIKGIHLCLLVFIGMKHGQSPPPIHLAQLFELCLVLDEKWGTYRFPNADS